MQRPTSGAIGAELREGRDPWLVARRRIATIAAVLSADFALLGLAQLGAIRRVPDLPVRGFDANRVLRAPEAYPLGVPDTALATAGCGAIVALAAVGGSERTGRKAIADVALGVATLGGVAVAAFYVQNMIRRQRVLCAYCLGGAAGFAAAFVLAAPGAVRAARRIARERQPRPRELGGLTER